MEEMGMSETTLKKQIFGIFVLGSADTESSEPEVYLYAECAEQENLIKAMFNKRDRQDQ